MKIKAKILMMLIIIFSSCKKTNEDKFINTFDQTKTYSISSKTVPLKSELVFSSMFKMSYLNDLLFISEIKDPDYEMKIVDLKTGSVRNFAKKGEGPDEIKYQGSNFSIDVKKNNLYLIDGPTYLVYNANGIKDKKDTLISKFSVDVNEDRFMESTYYNGYIIGGLHEKRFGLYNLDTKSMVKKVAYNKDLPKGALNNQAFFLNHPNKNLVAYFYYKSAIFGIITLGNNDLEVKEKIYWKTDNEEIVSSTQRKIEHKKNQVNGFISAAASDRYIYVLYSGKSLNVNTVEDLTQTYLSKYIYVFDWKGNPVKRYELDQEVRSVAVDQKDSILYAATYKNNEPHLIQYNLTN